MGLASALSASPAMGLQWGPLSGSGSGHRLQFVPRRAHLIPPLRLPSRSSPLLAFARRRNREATIPSSPRNNPNNSKLQRLGKNGAVEEEDEEEEEIDDDAFEALFAQLEEDLKKDDPSLFDGDDEISEEDLAKLDAELAAIDEEIAEVFDMAGYKTEDGDEDEDEDAILVEVDEDEDEDEDEEEQPLQLRNWQLRRLAMALRTGRRKTNIKSLAAELCIDRAIVLELLRNPPPSLLMLSAALPDDEPSSPIITITETKTVDTVTETTPEPKRERSSPDGKVPVHVMQQKLASQKRIKKSHVQTLEDVYRRTKRPTNAMIQSIVDVTSLPRKRVVKWFEDKRTEEGVPEERLPYQRSVPDS